MVIFVVIYGDGVSIMWVWCGGFVVGVFRGVW